MTHGPLQGVKVVACSTAQAGTVPYMLMADLGAEVIKIEVPEGGDNSRGSTVFPGFPSTYFETNNRGVKSVTLNLKAEEGRAILRQLVARADMFGQNFRPGAAEKNGFGYEESAKSESEAGLHFDLRIRPGRSARRRCPAPTRWRRRLAGSLKLTPLLGNRCARASFRSLMKPVRFWRLAARWPH